MLRLNLLLLSCVATGNACAQAAATPAPWSVTAMLPDRVEDSYLIYSSLLPLGETETWPTTFFAVRDATVTAVAPGEPCNVPEAHTPMERARSGQNPHASVTPPEGDRKDYDEVLADFDAHCHERLALTADGWRTRVPVHLLNDTEQNEFLTMRQTNSTAAAKYNGSPSLYSFSQVYFNAHHTVALVYATHVCGGLCGQGYWMAFQKVNGGWKRLGWSVMAWIS